MAACTWRPENPVYATLSNANLTATSTQAGVWHAIFGTLAAAADYPGGRLFEVSVDTYAGSVSNIMIGLASLTANQIETHKSSAYLYYSAGNVWHANSASGSYATYGEGDVITILLKNGKLYAAKNGTWINSGDPDAETGYIASGLTGDWYPCVLFYDANPVTLHCNTTIAITLPTGVYPWDQTVEVDVTLVGSTGTPVASTAVEWAVFASPSPDGMAAPEASGTDTTDGSGVLSITYLGTMMAPGDAGSIVISTTAGDPDAQSQAHFAPVEPTIS